MDIYSSSFTQSDKYNNCIKFTERSVQSCYEQSLLFPRFLDGYLVLGLLAPSLPYCARSARPRDESLMTGSKGLMASNVL